MKDTRRYRYYVSRPQAGERLANERKARVPAGELERVVIEQMIAWLLREDLSALDRSPEDIANATAERRMRAGQVQQGSLCEKRARLLEHGVSVELQAAMIRIRLDVPGIGTKARRRATFDLDARFVDRGSDLQLMAPFGPSGPALTGLWS